MKSLQLTRGQVAIVDNVDDTGIKWYCGSNGYACRKVKNKPVVTLHRYVMSRKLGRELLPTEHVDHINRHPLDCRRANLRLCTPSLNASNARLRSDNTTGVKGVVVDKRNGRFVAQYYISGKKQHIGTYQTLEAAALARRDKEVELYGEFVMGARKPSLPEPIARSF